MEQQPNEERGIFCFEKYRNDQTFGEESKHQHDSPSKAQEESSISNTSFPAGTRRLLTTHCDPQMASGPGRAAEG